MMASFKRDKKEDEDGINPYQHLEKTSVLQETRVFNETPVNARRCITILSKIMCLLNQGDQLGSREATECFFAMTKLFQSKDVILRRMVYLGIKELSTIAEDVIIVTSSLTKDMTGKEDLYRASAIRALSTVTDGSMLQTLERYMKQCIVDRNAPVSSAALVSSLHLTSIAQEVIKRWSNEVSEALSSDNIMVQYHALGLLYFIRRVDKLAVSKLVKKLISQNLKSPYGVCFLIRVVCKLIEDEDDVHGMEGLFEYIESCLRHKNEMVIYEAASAIVNLKRTSARELAPAVSILQLFCGSSKATLRFAAVRTMNKVAMAHPAAITACNLDLEGLIADSNRSVATLAITTLLKTGGESSVERLMKQIASFVTEISDEFKIVVVDAIKALCAKFPRKHSVLMSFLSSMLREEGGLDYKTSIIDTIIKIIEENVDAKESGLAHLCEFIEDCEHTPLAVRILHLLGKEGPLSKNPSKYIRFIYNRIILENATIRAASVSALAQFGALCPSLLSNVLVLLKRSQMDGDDEVRDRATYYYLALSSTNSNIITNYVVEDELVSLSLLEKSLKNHLLGELQDTFDIFVVPKGVKNEEPLIGDMIPNTISKTQSEKEVESNFDKLFQIPGMQRLGPLHKSSESVQLTENETEYTVSCIKHCFQNHMIFQFNCMNTLADQLLENVKIDLVVPEGFSVKSVIPCQKLPYGEKHSSYVIVEFPQDKNQCTGTFAATLKFMVKDCDPATGLPESDDGYADEYMLEDLEVSIADQVKKSKKPNFQNIWETSNDWSEMEDVYTLSSVSNIQDAVNTILNFYGLGAANGSEKVQEDSNCHTLQCSGAFRGNIDVLVRAKFILSDAVNMQLTVRSMDADVAELLTSSIG